MSEIVYYDSNPTVRAILGKQFEQYGLKLVHLESLDQTASVLAACRHPVIIVLDMSRNPEKLSYLQSIIPQYIRAPERCILMSVQPTSLAPYLPVSIDECFFKHVIERPFKRLDFIQFFDEIVQPYLKNSKSLQLSAPNFALNSGISQIVSQSVQVPVDNFKQEVEDIVISTSRAIPLARLQEKAQEQPPDDNARRDSRMSRRSRGSYLSHAKVPAQKETPAHSDDQSNSPQDSSVSAVVSRETPSRIQNRIRHVSHASQAHEPNYHSSPQQSDSQSRINTSSASQSDSQGHINTSNAPHSDSQGHVNTSNAPHSDSKGRASVRHPHSGSQPKAVSMRSDSQVREVSHVTARDTSDAQNKILSADVSSEVYPLKHLSQSFPVSDVEALSDKITQSIEAPAMNEFSEPFRQPDQDISKSWDLVSMSVPMDDDEIESTLNVSPEIMSGLIEPVSHSPSIIQSSAHDSLIRTNFQITWLLGLIRQSHLSGETYTIIIRKNRDFLVIVLKAGKVAWIECIPGGQFMDSPSFIHQMSNRFQMPKTEILALLKKNITLTEALISLHLESLMAQICEDQLPKTLHDIVSFEGCPTHVFRKVPPEWQKLVNSRPEHAMNLIPYLFATVRDNADMILPPKAFRSFRFAARSNRTPLNYSIQLDPHESDMLAALRTPKLLPELRVSGKKNVTDTVYRLYLFEFVDVVY